MLFQTGLGVIIRIVSGWSDCAMKFVVSRDDTVNPEFLGITIPPSTPGFKHPRIFPKGFRFEVIDPVHIQRVKQGQFTIEDDDSPESAAAIAKIDADLCKEYPPALQGVSELKNLLSRIENLAGEISKVRPLQPETEKRIMEKFRLDWNYHSNAIEGNKLTLGETKAFLLEGLTADGKPLKDHLDIRGYDEVITYLAGFVQRKEVLTESVIRELHKLLLHEPYKVQARTPQGGSTWKWVKLGEYKTEPNFVLTTTGAVKQFTLPQDTPAKMQELMEWFRKTASDPSTHPIMLAAIFHNRFTQIHPFDDGNGRMARILMNLILMQHGLLPVVIKIQNRDQYIAALVKADVGEQNELLTLVANEEIHSEELFLRGAKGEDVSDFEDIDKRIALLKQELQHREKPAELTTSVQKEFIVNLMAPFITRLAMKVSQFDELFASKSIHVNGSFIAGPNYRPSGSLQQWNSIAKESVESQCQQILQNVEQENRFTLLDFVFFWDGFQRAGLNTFQYQFQVKFHFDKYQYRISVQLMNQQSVFEAQNVYQVLPTEDQIRRALTKLAEAILDYVQRQADLPKR